ncbi:MAG: hypothetical protein GY754_16865 [bacterium]|nr:hypothetical protein [bacterium]
MNYLEHILNVPNLSFSSTKESGQITCSYGYIQFDLEAFDAPETNNKPPDECRIKLKLDNGFDLYDGTILWKRSRATYLEYEVWKQNLSSMALNSATDENGNDCFIPMSFGRVEHMEPQRAPDRNGSQTYYKADFEGEIGTGWHAYEFREVVTVIDNNWIDNGDGTITRTSPIRGGLTWSGTGTRKTLADIFVWGCERLGLILENIHGADIPIDTVISGNVMTMDFLEKVSWYCMYRFYIINGTLRLIDMRQNNGITELEKYSFVPPDYDVTERIKILTADWVVPEITTDDNGDSVLRDIPYNSYIFGKRKQAGKEEAVNVFNIGKADVDNRIAEILTYLEMEEFVMNIPRKNFEEFPLPMQEIVFAFDRGNSTIKTSINAEGISYDPRAEMLTITGKGVPVYENRIS